MKINKNISSIFKHGLLIILVFISIFPLYWMIVSSFKGQGEIFNSSLIPSKLTLENYSYAFEQLPINKMMLNSFIIAGFQTIFQLLTAVLAAYAFLRYEFKFKKIIMIVLSITWLIPIQAIMIPNYITVVGMNLKENALGVIIPHIASTFAILNLIQSFQSFPKALLESARMEGDSDLGILFRIIIPNMGAVLASLGILLFITSWNDYLWPRLILTEMEHAPIQIGLRSFVNSDANQWGSLMAATTISSLPILIIYILFQKKIVNSFVKMGIK